MEWDWEGARVEHQTPILGRWALLAVRIDHAGEEPPPVVTRVLDSTDEVLAESLAQATLPLTEAIEQGKWRTEFLFHLPGELYQADNRIVHVIDPEREFQQTGNASAPIVLHGETPPKFRAVFIPIHSPEDEWQENLDPGALMAGTLAFMPIADDFEARIAPGIEVDEIGDDPDEHLLRIYERWNANAEADEFYHGLINDNAGGVALLASQVAVSELSIHVVIPHEFGHNLNLEHTPGCRAEGVDDNYPYEDGALGPDPAWERNWRLFASGEDDKYTDIMSYCTEFKLVSDYNYQLATDYWLAFGAQTSTSTVVSASGPAPGPVPVSEARKSTENGGSIAFAGQISAGGVWSLNQAQRSEQEPRQPANNGEHTLILFDAASVQIYAEPLSVTRLSIGDESFWAARIPPPVRGASEIVILDSRGNEVLRESLPDLN